MDTLNVIPPPTQGSSSGPVQILPKKTEQPNLVAPVTATPVHIPEQKDQENKQQISNAVKDINNFFQMAQRSLDFSIDEATGHLVMQIKDTKTNEVIRQVPGEDALLLAKRLDDVKGVLFKAQA